MRNAFTLVELLVCIAILAVLIGTLLPVLSNSKKNSYKSVCQSNLRTIGQTVRLYIDDYDGEWPDDEVWTSWNRGDNVFPPSQRPASFPRLSGCPSVDVPAERQQEIRAGGDITGYAFNSVIGDWNYIRKFQDGEYSVERIPITDRDFAYPATTVVFFDAALGSQLAFRPDPHEASSPYPYDAERGWERHNGGGNYLFADNHVQWLKKERFDGTTTRFNDGTRPTFALDMRRTE